jgi:membrane associated rhomboid family serine protease
MLIPLRTDAPIYHWPFITVGLIVANFVCFAMTGGAFHRDWILEFGTGLHPEEWISSVFLHEGWGHIIGNMIFLWGFGIIVEGKIGWWRFLLLYLAVGAASSFVDQAMMLGYDGKQPAGAGGASGVIFGLLAISMIWAPRNDITLFMLFFLRPLVFEVSIVTFCCWFIGWEFLKAWIWDFEMSSEMLHLIGAAAGAAAGIVMVKLNLVDCDGWDLFSVMRGKHRHDRSLDHYRETAEEARARKEREERKSRRKKRKQPRYEDLPEHDEIPSDGPPTLNAEQVAKRREKAARTMTQLLREKKFVAAFTEYERFVRHIPDWKLDEACLRTLANGLYKQQDWTNSVPLMREYVQRFPKKPYAIEVRLKLAAVLVQEQRRPRAALELVKTIPKSRLDERLGSLRERIVHKAQAMIADGVLELDVE